LGIRNTYNRGELKAEEVQNQLSEVHSVGLDMLKECMSTEYQKDYWK
jgi:hypothetical protein